MVVLKPGEFFFGSDGERIKTLLGSCVAITLWHPQKKVGGMCHFLLPESPNGLKPPFDGRYCDHAMQLFDRAMRQHHTSADQYQVKLFGGANMFPNVATNGGDIGRRNIEAARSALRAARFRIADQHVGEVGHRTVILELHSGHTWIKWQG